MRREELRGLVGTPCVTLLRLPQANPGPQDFPVVETIICDATLDGKEVRVEHPFVAPSVLIPVTDGFRGSNPVAPNTPRPPKKHRSRMTPHLTRPVEGFDQQTSTPSMRGNGC
jgi:hypothetical protein